MSDGSDKMPQSKPSSGPESAAALSARAMALAQAKRLEEAAEVYKKLVAIGSPDLQALNNLGFILTSLGRYEEALPYLRQSLSREPNAVQTLANLSIVLRELNRPEEALAFRQKIVALNPRHPEAICSLASTLSQLGRDEEAVIHFEKALTLRPNFTAAHYLCGLALAKLERHEEAVGHYRRAIALDPGSAAAANDLAMSLTKLGHHQEAVLEFERALRLMPGSDAAKRNLAVALKNFGRSLAELGQQRDAIAQYERALLVLPGFAPAYLGLGDALNYLGQPQEALAIFEKVLAADPGEAMAYLGIGSAWISIGRFQEARAAFEHAVSLSPNSAVCHRFLAEVARFTPGDPRLAALEALARDEERVPEKERPDLYFALGRAYDELQRFEAAFVYLKKANDLKRQSIVYDEARRLGELREIAAAFTPAFLAAHDGVGNPSDVPIFIVGMPRSGTTLVEQILASHPDVFGAGEISNLDIILEARPSGGLFPLEADLLSDEWLGEIGRRYVAELRALAPSARRITDKMPDNFRLIGLIRLALPNARIIHVRRNPLDTCFSCYLQHFRHLYFTYDLGELGRDYRAYEMLMAHWRNVLPQAAFLDVQYETLVDDFETEARRIVEYCGLTWDERCLAFHKTERPVRTQSVQQVRQPLYRSAIGRAKHYEQWLGPLRDALGIDDA
jgi:tetratricopeptide (TPR) repeat protein